MGCTTSKASKDGDASSGPSDATPTSHKHQSFRENSSRSFSSRRASGVSRTLDLDELKSNSTVTNSLTGLLTDTMGQASPHPPTSPRRANRSFLPLTHVTTHVAEILSAILSRRALLREPGVLAGGPGVRTERAP